MKPSVTCLRVKRAIQIHFDLIWSSDGEFELLPLYGLRDAVYVVFYDGLNVFYTCLQIHFP